MKNLLRFSTRIIGVFMLTIQTAWSASIVDIAVNDGRFTTLVQALTDADLVGALSAPGPFTVFAPVDDAFASVPEKFLTEPYSEHLKNILLYHVLSGSEVFSSDLMLNMDATTMNGESLTVTSLDPVQVDGTDVIIPDIDADNGVIHVVDEVLLPSAATKTILDLAVETPSLGALVDLLTWAGIDDLFAGEGSFTVFAPTTSAFEQLPADVLAYLMDPVNRQDLIDVLSYHVIPDVIIKSADLKQGATGTALSGGTLTVSSLSPPTINDSVVVQADVLANNGIVHVIDSVLVPPGFEIPSEAALFEPGRSDSTPEDDQEEESESASIVDIAVNDGRFTTLVQALTDADLVGALSAPGPFTVFAPVDDAFASVPEKFLTEPYSEHLKNILLYHVVSGSEVFSSDLMLNMEATTMNGESITVTSLDPVQIDGTDVIIPDIDASNGVIHVVDEVLLPSAAAKTILDLAVETPALGTLVDLVTAAGIEDLFAEDESFTVFAPTNSAFEQLPADVTAFLLDPVNRQSLIDVLSYHVVPDAVIKSSDLTQGATVTALSGETLTVSSLSPPTINDSVVAQADVLANNGIVHVIDSVLVPVGFEIPSNTALLEESEESSDDDKGKKSKDDKDD